MCPSFNLPCICIVRPLNVSMIVSLTAHFSVNFVPNKTPNSIGPPAIHNIGVGMSDNPCRIIGHNLSPCLTVFSSISLVCSECDYLYYVHCKCDVLICPRFVHTQDVCAMESQQAHSDTRAIIFCC